MKIGVHATILRYDTTGEDAVFSLRASDFGHNGGLCAAVMGPTFLVNTQRGVIGISAHRSLTKGRHHIAGVYDGKTIRLYIDGVLAAEQNASGPIVNASIPITVGYMDENCASLHGRVKHANILTEARSEDYFHRQAQIADCIAM